MKIGLVTHNVVEGDGQGRVNLELVRHLLDQGIQVDLFADRVDQLVLDLGAKWVPIHPGFDELILVKVWRFMRQANQALRNCSAQYDIVMGCGVTLNVPHSVNAVHFVNGTWLESPYHASKTQSGLQAWYQWLFSTLNAYWEQQVLEQADRVIAVSEMVRDELKQIGVPADKIDVIVNGVDVNEFAPGPFDRESLDLPVEVPLGIFVGDIRSPIKNLDAVLQGMAKVPEMHLAVVGQLDGSPYPSLAKELNVTDRVHFLGFRRDVADLMRASDFFLIPSRRDSCPLVLLEAMASGLPVVTSQMVGTSDLVADACGFVMAEPDDMVTLHRALRTLVRDTDTRIKMGHEARRVAKKHSWEKMARQYLHLFMEQVGNEEVPL